MNSYERVKQAINFQEADHVPLDLGGTTVSTFSKKAYLEAMNFRNLKAGYDLKLVDPIQQIISPSKEAIKNLKIDTIRIGARRIMNFEKQVVESNESFSILDPYDCEWQMNKSTDLYYNQVNYPLYDYETLTEGLENYTVYDLQPWREVLQADIEQQLQEIGGQAVVLDRNCAGLTEMSLRIRGYDKWFMDTIMDPTGVERLLDLLVDHKIAYWEMLIGILKEKNALDQVLVVSEADDLGTQTSLLLSPDSLKGVVIPRLKKLFEFLKQQLPQAKVMFHTDGAVKPILPDLIEAGVEILNPVQYTASGMNLPDLKKEFGRDLVFWGGGIDTQDVLNHGTPQQVRDEVKRNIEILAPGGGFVFTTIHNVQADVPPENFWAMWESWLKYGGY